MATPDLSTLSQEDMDYYNLLVQDLGQERADAWATETLQFYDIPIENELVPGTGDTRSIPGVTGEGTVPGSFVSPEMSEQEIESRKQANQDLRNQFLMQNTPVFMDEQQQAAYLSSVDRLVKEGFPDERILSEQYEIEFEMGVPGYDRSGAPPSTVGGELNMFDADSSGYALQLAEYTQKRLNEDVKGITAQQKAKAEMYGIESPRKPRAVEPYTMEPTPVQPSRLQMDPDSVEGMTGVEALKGAITPQVLKSGKDVRAEKAKKKMEVGQAFDIMKEEEIDAETYLNRVYENLSTSIEIQLSPISTDPFALNTMDKETYDQNFAEARNIAKQVASKKVQELAEAMYPDDEDLRESVYNYIGIEPASPTVMESISEGLQYLMTADADTKQTMYDMGLIEDPDAITESGAMAILRALNLPLRAILNPIMAQAENLGIIEREKADEEKESILPARRVEFTEDVDFKLTSPIDTGGELLDAYLKEIAVETATMRSLGNDVGQIKKVFGVDISEGMDETASVMGVEMSPRDFLVGAGTLSELFVPLIPEAKFLGLAGQSGGKLATKAAQAAKLTPKQTTQLARTAEMMVNTFAFDSLGLSVANRVVSRAADIAPDLMRNAYLAKSARGMGLAAKEAGAPLKMGEYFQDTAAVGNRVSDDIAEEIAQLEIQAKYPQDYADVIINDLVDAGTFRTRRSMLNQQEAMQRLDELANSNSKMITDTVAYLDKNKPIFTTRAGKFDIDQASRDFIDSATMGERTGAFDLFDPKVRLADKTYQDILEALTARHWQARQPSREIVRAAKLDDYVLLTPRTVVSKKWIDENQKAITEFFAPNGQNRFIKGSNERGVTVDISEVAEINFRVNDSDPNLFRILNEAAEGKLISNEDFRYLTDRILEEWAEGAITKVAKDVDLLERAAVEPARRGGITSEFARMASDVFDRAGTGISTWYKKNFKGISPVKPENITKKQAKALDEINAQTPESVQFLKEVEESTARLERTTKQTVSYVAKNINERKFNIQNNTTMGKSAQTYSTIMSNQATGRTFAEIQAMTPDELMLAVREMAQPYTNSTEIMAGVTNADVVMRNILKRYFGKYGTKKELLARLETEVLGNTVVDMDKIEFIYNRILSDYPELSRVLVDRPTEITSMVVSYEMRKQISNAAKRNFLNKPSAMAVDFAGSGPASITKPNGKPVFNSMDDYKKFLEEVVELRLIYPDGSEELFQEYAKLLTKRGIIKQFDETAVPKPAKTEEQIMSEFGPLVKEPFEITPDMMDFERMRLLKKTVGNKDWRNNQLAQATDVDEFNDSLKMLDEELKQLKAQEQSLIDEGGFYFPQSLTDEAIKGRAEKFA